MVIWHKSARKGFAKSEKCKSDLESDWHVWEWFREWLCVLQYSARVIDFFKSDDDSPIFVKPLLKWKDPCANLVHEPTKENHIPVSSHIPFWRSWRPGDRKELYLFTYGTNHRWQPCQDCGFGSSRSRSWWKIKKKCEKLPWRRTNVPLSKCLIRFTRRTTLRRFLQNMVLGKSSGMNMN